MKGCFCTRNRTVVIISNNLGDLLKYVIRGEYFYPLLIQESEHFRNYVA